MGVTSPAITTIPGRPHIRWIAKGTPNVVVLAVERPTNGGASLTGYQYSVNGRTWAKTPLGGRVWVRGLLARRTYTLRVRARNPLGVGLPSNSVRVRLP